MLRLPFKRDDGGPLALWLPNGTPVLIGVQASVGTYIADDATLASYPVEYERVGYYYEEFLRGHLPH